MYNKIILFLLYWQELLPGLIFFLNLRKTRKMQWNVWKICHHLSVIIVIYEQIKHFNSSLPSQFNGTAVKYYNMLFHNEECTKSNYKWHTMLINVYCPKRRKGLVWNSDIQPLIFVYLANKNFVFLIPKTTLLYNEILKE